MTRWLLLSVCLLVFATPVSAQDDTLAALVMRDGGQVQLTRAWASGKPDHKYAAVFSSDFGIRELGGGGSWGVVRFGVEWAIARYALSPDQSQLAFSAFKVVYEDTPNNRRTSHFEFAVFIHTFADNSLKKIDLDTLADIYWSPTGNSLILPAISPEGFNSPFYSGEMDTRIYDLAANKLYTLQAGDPPVFYVDGYDGDIKLESKILYFSATPPYVWLPNGRIVFQSGGTNCQSQCTSWRDIYVANVDGSHVQRLTTLEEQLPPEVGRFIRNFTWSSVDDRVYIELQGREQKDSPAIYSVDLTGNLREEVRADYSATYGSIAPNAVQGRVYVTLTDADRWQLLKLGGSPAAVEVVLDQSIKQGTFSWRPVTDAYSPDGRLVAINLYQSEPLVGPHKGNVQIVDVSTGALVDSLDTGAVCKLRWLDSARLLYVPVDYFQVGYPCPLDNIGLNLYDLKSRQTLPLVEPGRGKMLVLPM